MEDDLARHILAAILTAVQSATGNPILDAEIITRVSHLAADKYRESVKAKEANNG